MVHCETHYLKPGGLIAFVMPRSVITAAKQHRRFQARGLTRVLDLKGVDALFKTESCVTIRRTDRHQTTDIPTTCYFARVPQHSNLSLDQVQQHGLMLTEATTQLLGEVTVAGSYYYNQFKAGASLFPRNLCFVRPVQQLKPGDAAVNPAMETDQELDAEAKAPWKGVRLDGLVYAPNLYATLLSKNLMPFGVRKLHLVALPVQIVEGKLRPMREVDFLETGLIRSWHSWFVQAENKWDALKKNTSQFANLINRYNYQRTLTDQQPIGVYKVLYNGSGTHLSSCVVDTTDSPPTVYEYPTKGFIVDYKTYHFDTDNVDEAHYLCALLNAPCVDDAIKRYQTRGIYKGERDIGRTPFEACAIPPFDAANPDHLELALLSQRAHEIVAQTELTGSVYKARPMARAAVNDEIVSLDIIARRVLGFDE